MADDNLPFATAPKPLPCKKVLISCSTGVFTASFFPVTMLTYLSITVRYAQTYFSKSCSHTLAKNFDLYNLKGRTHYLQMPSSGGEFYAPAYDQMPTSFRSFLHRGKVLKPCASVHECRSPTSNATGALDVDLTAQSNHDYEWNCIWTII